MSTLRIPARSGRSMRPWQRVGCHATPLRWPVENPVENAPALLPTGTPPVRFSRSARAVFTDRTASLYADALTISSWKNCSCEGNVARTVLGAMIVSEVAETSWPFDATAVERLAAAGFRRLGGVETAI